MRLPELVAPAGDFEKLKAALEYGADAVYLGLERLSLRAQADNFDPEGLVRAVDYSHSRGKRVYVTLNAFCFPGDLSDLGEALGLVGASGADAAIISDPAALMMARKVAPDLPLHLSTQANVTNPLAAAFWKDQGVKRIVLARELSLGEIQAFNEVGIELEVFVHGAMCMAISGRCMFSEFLTGRSANQGDCAQPCRYEYTVIEAKRPHESYPVVEDEAGTYIFNARDLNLLTRLPELTEAGVTAIKLEGRAKSLHYVAQVTKTYREALDRLARGEVDFSDLSAELECPSHRPYTEGFYDGRGASSLQAPESTGYSQSRLLVGKVLKRLGETSCLLEVRNKLETGREYQLLPAKGPEQTFRIQGLVGAEGEALEVANVALAEVAILTDGAVGFEPGLLVTRSTDEPACQPDA